jgi:predicted Zn-dependent protease
MLKTELHKGTTEMTEKSAKRLALEASLAEDPRDSFLRYGLAMQCLRERATDEGRDRLKALIADHPEESIAAYQQLGQSFAETDELEHARYWLELGIQKARKAGESHAASEMQGLLETLV